jgi:hypothetical protein
MRTEDKQKQTRGNLHECLGWLWYRQAAAGTKCCGSRHRVRQLQEQRSQSKHVKLNCCRCLQLSAGLLMREMPHLRSAMPMNAVAVCA